MTTSTPARYRRNSSDDFRKSGIKGAAINRCYPQLIIRSENLRIPKGFRLKAQGWRAAPTLGRRCHMAQPQRGCGTTQRAVATPLGVETHSGPISQGSSFLATLGFVPESLWDSAKHTLEL